MIERTKGIWRDETALSTVEYAIAGALLTVAVIAAFTLLGGSISSTLSNLATLISSG